MTKEQLIKRAGRQLANAKRETKHAAYLAEAYLRSDIYWAAKRSEKAIDRALITLDKLSQGVTDE